MLPAWLSKWLPSWRFLTAALIAVLAVWTNPGQSEEGFRQHLRDQRTFALAHRFAESLGFLEVHVWHLGVLAVGREGARRWFLGAFDRWVELPDVSNLMQTRWSWPESRDPDVLLLCFVVLFALWQAAPRFMRRHFSASLCNLCAGRVWSLLTAQLSHVQAEHLLVNALFLYAAAPGAEELLGRRRFFLLYFVGGSIALVASLLLSPRLLKGRPYVECVGASGSLFAVLGYVSSKEVGVRWLGREWFWHEFALAQLALLAGFGSSGRSVLGTAPWQDVIAHLAGAAAGRAAAELRLL